MIPKLIASLNWILGTIALLGALLASFGIEKTFVQPSKDFLVLNVMQIVRAQKSVIAQGNDYVPFGRNTIAMARGFQELKITVPTDDFAYEAFREPNGDLVIRGMTTESGVLDNKIPPFIYRYTIPADGTGDLREFVELSGKRRGLAVNDLFSF